MKLAALLLAVVAAAEAAADPSRLFWTDYDDDSQLWSSQLDGSSAAGVVEDTSGDVTNPTGVVAAPQERTVYFAASLKIHAYDVTSGGSPTEVFDGAGFLDDVSALAYDEASADLYIADAVGQQLYVYNDGSITDVVSSASVAPQDVELDDSVSPARLYFTEAARVRSVKTDGTGLTTVTELAGGAGLALDTASRLLYIADADAGLVRVASMDGGSGSDGTLWDAGAAGVTGLTDVELDADNDALLVLGAGVVYSVALSNGAATLLATAGTTPRGVALYRPVKAVRSQTADFVSPAVVSAVEGGTEVDFYVVLDNEPSCDVTVTLTPDDGLAVNRASLVFNTTDWDVSYRVGTSAAKNLVREGVHAMEVALGVSSCDADYDAASVDPVTVSVADFQYRKLYFTNAQTDVVGRMNVDNTGQEDIITGVPHGVGLAVDSVRRYVYWVNKGSTSLAPTLSRVAFGSVTEEQLVTMTIGQAPQDVVPAGDYVYWSDLIEKELLRAPIDGGAAETVVAGLASPRAIAFDADSGGILIVDGTYKNVSRYDPDSDSVVTLVDAPNAGTGMLFGLAVGSGRMFWADRDDSALYSAFLNGTDVQELSLLAPVSPIDVAYDEQQGQLYWLETDGDIWVCGGAFEEAELLAEAMDIVTGIALLSDLPGAVITSAANEGGFYEYPGEVRFYDANDTALEGSTRSYQVRLDLEPTAAVTISIAADHAAPCDFSAGECSMSASGASGDHSSVTLSTSSLTFSTANWASPQNVTVGGVDDEVDQGARLVSLDHTMSSSDLNYEDGFLAQLILRVDEDDAAGISASTTSLGIDEGGDASLTLTLSTQPYADVTVSFGFEHFNAPSDGVPTPDGDHSELTTSPSSLVFTSSNWASAQTLTLTAVNDVLDQGTRTVNLTFAGSSDDYKYALTGEFDKVAVVVQDDDSGALALDVVLVTATEHGQCLDAAGVNDTFADLVSGVHGGLWDIVDMAVDVPDGSCVTGADEALFGAVALTPATLPYRNLTVVPSVSDPTQAYVLPRQLEFPGVAYASSVQTQTFYVIAQDDEVDEASLTVTVTFTPLSDDAVYQGLAASSVQATLEDNDQAGLAVNSTVTAPEGGAPALVPVALATEPTAVVELEVHVFQDPNDHSVMRYSPSHLAFSPANWTHAQTVTVTAFDDEIDQGDRVATLFFSATSADDHYEAANSEAAVADLALEFDDDALSADNGNSYGTELAAIDVVLQEDDVSAFNVTPAFAEAVECEDVVQHPGEYENCSSTIYISLATMPYAAVTVNVSTSHSQLRVVPEQLVFNGSAAGCERGAGCLNSTDHWRVPQPVELIAQENVIDDGDRLVNLTIVSTGESYNGQTSSYHHYGVVEFNETTGASIGIVPAGIPVQYAPVRILDDDEPLVTLTTTPLGLGEAQQELVDVAVSLLEGESTVYYVKLSIAPNHAATVHITPDDATQLAVDPSALVFTAATAFYDQEVTITALGNSIRDFTRVSAISHSVTSNDSYSPCSPLADEAGLRYVHASQQCETAFDGAAVAQVVATIDDDDAAAVAVLTESVLMSEGASATYQLQLLSQPVSDVTVSLQPVLLDAGSSEIATSDNQLESDPAAVVFTPANWDSLVAVEITTQDNAEFEGFGQRSLNLTHVSVATDANYMLPEFSVPIFVADDDAGCPGQYSCANGGQCVPVAARGSSPGVFEKPDRPTENSAHVMAFLSGSVCSCADPYGGRRCTTKSFRRVEMLVEDTSFDVSFLDDRTWAALAELLEVDGSEVYVVSVRDSSCLFSAATRCVRVVLDLTGAARTAELDLDALAALDVDEVLDLDVKQSDGLLEGTNLIISIFVLLTVTFCIVWVCTEKGGRTARLIARLERGVASAKAAAAASKSKAKVGAAPEEGGIAMVGVLP